MDEKRFKEKYRSAYDHVLPDADSIEKIMAHATEERRMPLPAIAALLFACILFTASLPVLAAHVPAVYSILERYVPDIADYVVPEEPECVDQGIIMRVEGIRLEGNHAEIVVSFGNQEGHHHIKGKVDMYDSYGLVSYQGVGTIGGCFFLMMRQKKRHISG